MEAAIDHDDILGEYIAEAQTHLSAMEHDLALLEIDPDNRHILRRLRETVDAIHGPSEILGFDKLTTVTSAGVQLIDRLAIGEVTSHPVTFAALENMVRAIHNIIGEVKESANEGSANFTPLVTLLQSLQSADFTKLLERPVSKSDPVDAPEDAGDAKDNVNGVVKLDRTLLNTLQRLTGDLVTMRNKFAYAIEAEPDTGFKKLSAELDRITSAFYDVMRPIPLSGPVAVIRAFAFSCRDEFFLLPQLAVREHLSWTESEAAKQVEFLFDTPVFRFDGGLIPLIALDHLLHPANASTSLHSDIVHVVVVEHDRGRFGLIVDDAQGVSEVVMQPLDEEIGRSAGIWGGAIMANGQVALMLNPNEIADRLEFE